MGRRGGGLSLWVSVVEGVGASVEGVGRRGGD